MIAQINYCYPSVQFSSHGSCKKGYNWCPQAYRRVEEHHIPEHLCFQLIILQRSRKFFDTGKFQEKKRKGNSVQFLRQ